MLIMPSGTTMHGKWESASMTPSQMPYKMERPAYSTPPPVENTPANNECRMVDLRGSKVASFCLGREEYICLPQAFDLFLKHLVGGLHTVYTKLKRLSIHPVVCNVEQVRILRGLGAIQPGVNRCKLITRKDFEVLYQDCTTASRPGRPPKRYPMLPPTADPMSHHANMRNNLMAQNDFSAYHKRMRIEHGIESSLNDRRASVSPNKDDDKTHSGVSLLPNDMHNSATANLAYLQALRHQYQQAAASGLHNGLDSQQINPALAPFMMMSHPALFSSGIPPNSMAMLNHINQLAQSHAAGGAMSTAAAAAAAQLVASGSPFHSNSNNTQESSGQMMSARENDKDSDADDDGHNTDKSYGNNNSNAGVINGIGSDGRTSPSSSVGSIQENNRGDILSDEGQAFRSSPKTSPAGRKLNVERSSTDLLMPHSLAKSSQNLSNEDDMQSNLAGMSSMHNLLTNIQGLLKVAADNANLQEKHSSFEIADLKLKLSQERQLREGAERKIQECEREKVETQGELNQERKENKRLQAKIISMQRMLGHDFNAPENDAPDHQSPKSNSTSSPHRHMQEVALESTSPPTSGSSPITMYPQAAPAFDSFSARIAAVQATSNQRASPPVDINMSSNASNANNSNNYAPEEQPSPDFVRRNILPEGRAPDLAIDLGMPRQDRSEHLALQDARLYFKNSLLFQPSASQ